jgi:Na+/H+ antiporter NhaC
MHAVPYMVFGFVGIALVFTVVMGWTPIFGKMKAAEARALGGVPVPPDPDKTVVSMEAEAEMTHKPLLIYFVLPLVVLLSSTIYFDFDALKGALIANFFTFCLLAINRAMTIHQLTDSVLRGFNTILFPIILVIMAFVLKLVNDDLNLVPYVISHVQPYMSKETFPAIAFLTLAAIAFLTGSSWDLYVIAIPLIIPLAQNLGANVWVAVSVVTCAGAFGSNAAFFSDSTILSASSTECPTMVHALTQLPYSLIALGGSVVAYLVIGMVG